MSKRLQVVSFEHDFFIDVYNLKFITCLLALCLLLRVPGFSQRPVGEFDTTRTAQLDTLSSANDGKKITTIESYAKRFDPRKAILYSAVFPGAGQAYNKKYWKLPLVYGGFYGIGFVISKYQGRYNLYKSELFSILNNPGTKLSPRGYTEDQLRSEINVDRRQRDFWTALIALWYVLQMVDAHIDAHLKEFDLNPRLQVRLEPSMNASPLTGRSTGLSLKLKF